MNKDLRHHELITNLQAIKHQLKDLTDAIVSLGHAYQLPQTTLQPHNPSTSPAAQPPKPWYWEPVGYPAPADDQTD